MKKDQKAFETMSMDYLKKIQDENDLSASFQDKIDSLKDEYESYIDKIQEKLVDSKKPFESEV